MAPIANAHRKNKTHVEMTIRGLLEKWTRTQPDAVLFKYFENDAWQTRSYAAALEGVRAVAEGYGTRFGLKPGEENAALILTNGPVWIESYLAQTGTGAAVVPIDPKLHDAEVEYILRDAEVRVVTTDLKHLRMMMKIAKILNNAIDQKEKERERRRKQKEKLAKKEKAEAEKANVDVEAEKDNNESANK